MTGATDTFNPFPGLRPFGSEEDHLFFGREQIVDQLLMRLRGTRFLGVIGSSGCGKSSLVRAGLMPSLHSGYMTTAGSSWRVAMMRPGTDPIVNLAVALNQPDVLGHQPGVEKASPVLTEVTLRRSNLGLVECVRLARLPQEDNLLIVVDQFEELFRFKRSGQAEGARDEAIAFVKRLLRAADQQELPIYVVLTMRSDFIGECHEYPGLPEAINEGQFLVPWMTREQLRSAIAGPIMVASGEIAPRLLVRLVNDVGDNPHRLPILQHALMRTWNHWQESRAGGEPIDNQHYEAIGTIEHALSSHADEAYEELDSNRAKNIAAKVFKALTDTNSDNLGVRRPTTIGRLCLIAEASQEEITAVINAFRRLERSFLMPPIGVPLEPETVVDISHESLMRIWDRLIAWTRDENTSARTYMRLARAATRYEQGTTGLWRDPDLEIASKWCERTDPTEAWATRYNPAFEQAMSFLDQSKEERDRRVAEKRNARRKRLQTAWGVSVVLLVIAVYALFQQQRAEDQQQRAELNFQLALRAVDEMLTDVEVEDWLADIPQSEELRQNLLERGRMFLETLDEDKAAAPQQRLETALAQVRLGRIYQYQGQREKAETAHGAAIDQLSDLYREFSDRPLFQFHLAEAYNLIGEQLRPYDGLGADTAYNNALDLQRDLVERFPDNLEYSYGLGRMYNNRGILFGSQVNRVNESKESFEQAISLFEELRVMRDDPLDTWRLARTKNSFAIMLAKNDHEAEAESFFGEAVVLVEDLVNADSKKREYREGLASMYNNLSNLHLRESNYELALEANTKARLLFDGLATPVHGLRIEIANSYNTRGGILTQQGRMREAVQALWTAWRLYNRLELESDDFENDPLLNDRYGKALANLAILDAKENRFDGAARLVTEAIKYFGNAANSAAPSSEYKRSLSQGYGLLADYQLKSGDYIEAVKATESLAGSTQDQSFIYRAALFYARATDLVVNDASLTVAERGNIVESYMERTVSLLDLAIAGGYSLKRLETDGRFGHLQNREDFRRLLSGARETQNQ